MLLRGIPVIKRVTRTLNYSSYERGLFFPLVPRVPGRLTSGWPSVVFF